MKRCSILLLAGALGLVGCDKLKSMMGSKAATPALTPTAVVAKETPPPATPTPAPVVADAFPKEKAQKVVASVKGFAPATIKAHVGKPVAISFLRTDDKTCAKDVVGAEEGDRHRLA